MPHTSAGWITDPEYVRGAHVWARMLNDHMDLFHLTLSECVAECSDGLCPIGTQIDKSVCRLGDDDAMLVSRNHMMVLRWVSVSGAWHVLVAP